ncbi:MAG: LytTR family transcriptional regulator DNA-binding domain-containing protein [Bacteroidota bacterium]
MVVSLAQELKYVQTYLTIEQHRFKRLRVRYDIDESALTTEYIMVADINFFQAADQYVQIHTAERQYLLRQTMDALEKQLNPNQFFRTHRSAIVALANIKAIHQDEFKHHQVILQTGESLPLSQVRKPDAG